MKVSLTEIFCFSSAHRLYNNNWDFKKNSDVFGKCNLPNFHGHNYNLEVKVTGNLKNESGSIIDCEFLKRIVNKEIIELFDYKNLNIDIPYFSKFIPTVENISIFIWNILRKKIDNNYLLELKLYETERNFVIFKG